MLQLVVSKELAEILHQHADVTTIPIPQQQHFRAFFTYLKENAISPQPVFPNATDESLITFFSIDANVANADALQSALLKLHGVEGAYWKPSDELPAR